MKPIQTLAIVGGTHGNEHTGIQLVKNWLVHPGLVQKSTFETKLLLANTQGIQLNRRYSEFDLNRCFAQKDLNNPNPPSWEHARAQEINQILGPKGSPQATDLILDLHNSTANMGITLIFSQVDLFIRQLCVYLNSIQNQLSLPLYFYSMPEDAANTPYLPSIGKRDICIEVGPQAHGSVLAKLLENTQKLTLSILEFTEQWNLGKVNLSDELICFYEHSHNLDFPRNDLGEICGYIHSDLQNCDYQKLTANTPLFWKLSGEVIYYQDLPDFKEGLDFYPVFINEQAYYEKGIALSLTKKAHIHAQSGQYL